MREKPAERKKRQDLVLSVFIAAAVGFVLNLLSNVYYGLFILHNTNWKEVSHIQVYGLLFVLVALAGFLKFFIDDYENDVELSRNLLKRFTNYFFYEFTPGRIIRVIGGLYILVVLVGVAFGLFVFLANITGYLLAAIILLAAAVFILLRLRKRIA